MKLNFILHGVSLRFYQLKIMKVVTTPDLDKVAKKVFLSLYLISNLTKDVNLYFFLGVWICHSILSK